MKKILLLLFCLGLGKLFAQDTIIKLNDEKIVCKIIEIGPSEIKYKFYNNETGPVVIIYKFDVWKIKLKDNTEVIVTEKPKPAEHTEQPQPAHNDQTNPATVTDYKQEREQLQKEFTYSNQVIKFDLLSAAVGNLTFGFERPISNYLNAEVKLGFIGYGIKSDLFGQNVSGIFFKAAPKLYFAKLKGVTRGKKYARSPVEGVFTKIEFIYSSYTDKDGVIYSNNYYSSPSTYQTVKVNAYGLDIVFGGQFLMLNTVSLEFYVGLGLGGLTYTLANGTVPSSSQYLQSYFEHSHFYLGSGGGPPFIFTTGFTMGYAF